jgi:protein-L-isoaspartate(D-aspartate) O-methyltransferase
MSEDFAAERERMVEAQIRARGVQDDRVLQAMLKVPRHSFVPPDVRSYAYGDEPLPIGEGQTISQPYIVAYMTEALELRGDERVLEIGTGSGYQTAVLAELAREVYTIEIVSSLSQQAQETLRQLGYQNVFFRVGDGSLGWREFAPYDAIIVTAAPRSVPKALEEQLKTSGKMIIPVGIEYQELVLVERKKKGFSRKKLLPVRFVPLVSVH